MSKEKYTDAELEKLKMYVDSLATAFENENLRHVPGRVKALIDHINERDNLTFDETVEIIERYKDRTITEHREKIENSKGFLRKAWERNIKPKLKETFVGNSANGGGGDEGNDEPPNTNFRGNFNMVINWKAILGIVVLILTVAVSPLLFGINDAGNRTVVQYPNGKLFVKFEPGFYTQWFGNVTVYRDVVTYDFDRTAADGETSIDVDGIPVRYQDGGTGTIFGKARFDLPKDDANMLKLHKAFRSNGGVAYKLIKTVTDEAQNLTAGLMTSEGAYAEQRGTYIEWSRDQVTNGKYRTELKQDVVKDEVTGKSVVKNIPVIAYGEDGLAKRFETDLKAYGITVSGYQITDWGFEQKTLDQIAEKRKATMAIITAKAKAEQAKQEAITAEENGKRDVTIAKYEKEQEKIRAVVDAEKAKAVAILGAEKLVEVAAQQKLEKEQLKLAALEYEGMKKAEGRGDSEYKRLVLEADGALQQKLDAEVKIHNVWAQAYANRAVPQNVTSFGGSGDGTGPVVGGDSEVANFMNMMTMQAAKQLTYDRSTTK